MQSTRGPLDPAFVVITCLAAALWIVTGVAVLSMLQDDSVGFDGGFLIGSAIPAAVATLFAVLFYRSGRT